MTKDEMQKVRKALTQARRGYCTEVDAMAAFAILDAALTAAPQPVYYAGSLPVDMPSPALYMDRAKFASIIGLEKGGILTMITRHQAFTDDVALYTAPVAAPQREYADHLAAEFRKELDALSQRNYELRLENAALKEKNHG